MAASIGRPRKASLDQSGVQAMVDQALAALAEQQSTWRRNDLVRELARAVPPTLTVDAHHLARCLDDVADGVVDGLLVEYAATAEPDTPRRRDGRPVTESPLDRRFTTPAIVAEEQRIMASIERRTQAHGRPRPVATTGLDRCQFEVARAVAGTDPLVVVVGPAGTGKTTALRPAVAALHTQGRHVFGLASSATAAAVLSTETGMPADTVDKLLPDTRTGRRQPPPPDTTVVVDEASMLATPKLAELLALADRQRWRLVLVGDPLQLSAVGRGGMFALLAAAQPTLSLETVHRFARPWERHASLALRTGAPDALDAYQRRGRLHDGPPALVEDALVDHWRDVRTTGTTAVLCTTNRSARRLNARLQAERHAAGELTGTGLRLPSGEVLHVGDVIATRRNDRTLRSDRGAMVKNRARWTIRAINRDRSITLAGSDGRITLPAAYVTDHVELAYAETIHAAQGRTVDHALLLADGPIDGHALHVAMTRG